MLLAAGLFALGTGVRIAKLRKVGPRPFLLGLGSWVVIAVRQPRRRAPARLITRRSADGQRSVQPWPTRSGGIEIVGPS